MIVLLIIILVFIVAGVAANTVFFALAMKKLKTFDGEKKPDAGVECCLSEIIGGINEIKQMIDEMPAREMGARNWEDFSAGLNNIMSYSLDDAYRKPGDMK